MSQSTGPRVGIIMGSRSDWETLKAAADMLDELEVSYECRVVSAHRTPLWMVEYAQSAASRGLQVIVAGAGGAAHLPGMVASMTHLPVLGVPVQSKSLSGLDSLLSIAQCRRNSCWHFGHWHGWGQERRVVGGSHPVAERYSFV